MNVKNFMRNAFYYVSVVMLPVVVYYLKNKYTTIEIGGNQFSTMSTIFPAYFILTLIIIWVLWIPDIKRERDISRTKTSENI
jgi:uncharacterized membrane protein YhaH (DUF805 family)